MIDGDTAPQLDVAFRRHPTRGTYIDRRLFRWPYTLSRGFRLDTAPAHMLTAIVQTASGAINADDRLRQRLRVGPDAAAHVTTQGATVVNRAFAGHAAADDVALLVDERATLEYLPEPRILFPRARLSQRVAIQAAESATVIVGDGFVPHDPERTGHGFARFHTELELRRPDGTLLALDRIELDAMPVARGARARFRAFGALLVATSRSEAWVAALCAGIDAAMPGLDRVYAAASPLPNQAGLSLRVAASDGRHLRAAMRTGWSAARAALFGAPPPPRRF